MYDLLILFASVICILWFLLEIGIEGIMTLLAFCAVAILGWLLRALVGVTRTKVLPAIRARTKKSKTTKD